MAHNPGKASILLLVSACLSGPAVTNEMDAVNAAIRVRDYDSAVPLLEAQAGQGNAQAQYQLASLYRSGTGVPRDHEAAVGWLRKAAESGHPQAQYNLGVMYENGWGTTVNTTLAENWYRRAALQDHPMAREKLGPLQEFDHDSLEGILRPLATELGLKAGQLFTTLRVATTGRTAAPPLFQTMAVLGKEKCLRRIEAAIGY